MCRWRSRRPARSGTLTSLHQCIKMQVMRTTVTLDDDVYEAAVHLSQASGERLGQVLSTLLRRALMPPPAEHPRKTSRFPSFEVPPDAPIIPASRVQHVIDEEGPF